MPLKDFTKTYYTLQHGEGRDVCVLPLRHIRYDEGRQAIVDERYDGNGISANDIWIHDTIRQLSEESGQGKWSVVGELSVAQLVSLIDEQRGKWRPLSEKELAPFNLDDPDQEDAYEEGNYCCGTTSAAFGDDDSITADDIWVAVAEHADGYLWSREVGLFSEPVEPLVDQLGDVLEEECGLEVLYDPVVVWGLASIDTSACSLAVLARSPRKITMTLGDLGTMEHVIPASEYAWSLFAAPLGDLAEETARLVEAFVITKGGEAKVLPVGR